MKESSIDLERVFHCLQGERRNTLKNKEVKSGMAIARISAAREGVPRADVAREDALLVGHPMGRGFSMKKLVVGLAVLFGALAAQAAPVAITYSITGTLIQPTFVGPLGPPGTGSLTLTYSAASANSSLASLVLPPGASVGLASGPVHLEGFSFMQLLSFAIGGDVFMGTAMMAAGPSAAGLLAGGSLMVPLIGGFSGALHCAGATCAAVGFPASITVPLAAPLGASLMALVGVAPGIALGFPFGFLAASLPTAIGLLPITAMLTATEISRHVVPEPATTSLLGLGLVGLAVWRARRGRKL